MAKELNVPILLLSQLSRASEKRDKKSRYPMLSDLRESGAIEQDADVVIFLHREDYYPEDKTPENMGKARIIIAKQRSGPTGAISMQWQGEYTKYMEVDYVHDCLLYTSSGMTLTIPAKHGGNGKLFGAITAKEIAAALEEKIGVAIDKKKISAPNIKELGEYDVSVKVYAEVSTCLLYTSRCV